MNVIADTTRGDASPDEALLTTQAASEFLQAQLPRDNGGSYWRQFLINNRRTDRTAQVAIPVERWGRMALYRPVDLMRYVELERSRQLGHIQLSTREAQVLKAYGVGEPGGGSTGRKLECRVSPQLDQTTEAAGSMFVQLVITKPLLVYRLSVAEARSLMQELGEALSECERGGCPATPRSPTTATRNPS